MTRPARSLDATEGQRRLLAELATHTGSPERFRHSTKCFVYTSGVRSLARDADAYWLLDAVASLCRNPNLRRAEVQVWTLTVHSNRSAVLIVTDRDEIELLRHTILYTDFPLDRISLLLIDRTLLLPSEY